MASSSDLEVEVDKQRKKTGCLSTTDFELPEDLPSVEEALKAFGDFGTPGDGAFAAT